MKTETLMVAAAFAACVSFAQEEAAASSDGASGEEIVEGVAKPPEKPASEIFSTLPFCREMSGMAQVQKPGGSWAPMEEGRFYPLGSIFRTSQGARAVVAFGKNSYVEIEGDSSFESRAQPLGGRSRTIVPLAGTVFLSLPENIPEGAFFVTTPGFTVKNPAGNSKYVCAPSGDGIDMSVRCVTGAMEVEGRHFVMPRLRAANEFKIRSSHDNLVTIITGVSGDFVVRLDQGLSVTTEIDDDGKRVEKTGAQTLDWHLTPETHVQIDRAVPEIGGKMSVHTMAFDAAGVMQSERGFCEDRFEINTGELVMKEKSDGDELAKRAAEATEAAAEETEEAKAEDASGGSSSAQSGAAASEETF